MARAFESSRELAHALNGADAGAVHVDRIACAEVGEVKEPDHPIKIAALIGRMHDAHGKCQVVGLANVIVRGVQLPLRGVSLGYQPLRRRAAVEQAAAAQQRSKG